MRVAYETTGTGVVVSIPIATQLPQYQQSQLTYQDGYDSDYSDGMIGPFFDAVDDQVADDDEIFDEAEHQGVSNISPSDIIENENLHPAVVEVTQNTYPPHYIPPEILRIFTNAKIQEELQNLKLPVGGRNDILMQRYYNHFNQPVVPVNSQTNSLINQPQQPQMTGFAPEAKWMDLKTSQEQVAEPNTQLEV